MNEIDPCRDPEQVEQPVSITPVPRAHVRPLARVVFTVFLLTFIAARLLVILIMGRMMPDLFLHMGGTHLHHLNYGIFLLCTVTCILLFFEISERERWWCAVAYGFSLALTFDEFGMWLHLGGGYWQRASFDGRDRGGEFLRHARVRAARGAVALASLLDGRLRAGGDDSLLRDAFQVARLCGANDTARRFINSSNRARSNGGRFIALCTELFGRPRKLTSMRGQNVLDLRGKQPGAEDWHGTCKRKGMKNLILGCLAAVSLLSLAACSCDKSASTTNTQQSSAMQTDTKDMHSTH